MRSTKRQPSTLQQPKHRFRHSTVRRSSRSMKLLVGSTSSTCVNVHSAGSNANRFSQKVATVLSSPKIAPSSKTRCSRFWTGSSWLCSCARVVWPSWNACPRGEDLFDDLSPGLAHEQARSAPIHDLLEIAFQMRPADLATLGGHLVVDAPAVAVQDAVDGRSQQRRQPDGPAPSVDQEGHHRLGGRGPQPTQLAAQLPTGLVGVLDLCRADGRHGFLVGDRQCSADLLLEVGHGAQRHGRVEDDRRDLLDAALADAMTAREIRQHAGEARPDTVGQVFARNGGVRNMGAARTGAGVALILRNERHDRRQLGLLKARRRGIIGCGVGRQSRLAVLTLPGHEGHKAIDAFGGRQLLQPRRMAPLAAGLAFRFLLADRLGRSERIGRRGHGGIGAVGAEPRFQRGDTLLQLGDTSVTGAASSTLRRVHAAMLENRAARAAPVSSRKRVERLRPKLLLER